MSPSATPATQNDGRCRQVPNLPRKTMVNVAKCHACHAKCRGDQGVHRTQARHQSQRSAISAAPATQNEGWCRQVPRLPRKTKVDVAKPPPATQSAKCRGDHGVHRTQARPEPASAISAAPATQNEGWCRQAPRLAHKTKVDVAKCHACHAKRRGDHGVYRGASPGPAQCHKCRACHAKRRSMSPSATPTTQNEGRCRQVPRLPRKVPRRPGRPPDPSAPPEPAQCHKCRAKVDVAKCHAYHAKRWSMSPSATPATQSAAATRASTGRAWTHTWGISSNLVPLAARQAPKSIVSVLHS